MLNNSKGTIESVTSNVEYVYDDIKDFNICEFKWNTKIWVFLKISQNSQENTCARVSFLIKLQAEVIFKNTFFTEHLRATTSAFSWNKRLIHYTLKAIIWLDNFLVEVAFKLFCWCIITFHRNPFTRHLFSLMIISSPSSNWSKLFQKKRQ